MVDAATPALILAMALGAGPAGDDCGKRAKNLLASSDCGFARGIAGWEPGTHGEKLSHDARSGDPSPGALKLLAGQAGSAEAVGPCLAAKANTTYRFGARFRVVFGNAYICGPHVHHYGDAACEDALGPLAASAELPKAEWQMFVDRPEGEGGKMSATTRSNTKAIRLILVCSGMPNFIVLFDDVFVTE